MIRDVVLIDVTNVGKEEVKELKQYLENNCWKWNAKRTKEML